MDVQAAVFSVLKQIADVQDGAIARVYPRTTPDNPTFPLIVYELVGGSAYEYVERKLPDCEHYRVQVMCSAKTATKALEISGKARKLLVEANTTFPAVRTAGQVQDASNDELKLYAFRQDFLVWLKAR